MSNDYVDQRPYDVVRLAYIKPEDVVALIIEQRRQEAAIDETRAEVDKLLMQQGQKPYFKDAVACIEPTDYTVEKIYCAMLTGNLLSPSALPAVIELQVVAQIAIEAAKVLKAAIENDNKENKK